jgi:hypothetical protein
MQSLEYYKSLWARLPKDIPANLEFAKLVSEEEINNIQYFFADYSVPIIKWIAITIYSNKPLKYIIPFITSDYFFFAAEPIDKKGKHWKQLTSYKGINGQKLKSWLMHNAHQWFARKHSKQQKKENIEGELLEFVDYESLLMLGNDIADYSAEELIYLKRLQKAWNLLSEKDKDIIQILIIDKLHWIDAYDELKDHIKPKKGKAAMESWPNKKKQDALASLKGRAVRHLIEKFNIVK